jgi:hypothetical protein
MAPFVMDSNCYALLLHSPVRASITLIPKKWRKFAVASTALIMPLVGPGWIPVSCR